MTNKKSIIIIGITLLLTVSLIILLNIRYTYQQKLNEDQYFLIGVSQPNLYEPWRVVMNAEIINEAKKHHNIRVIFTDGAKSTDKQVSDINKLMDYGIDLLIISMDDSEALTPVIANIYKQIPVIVLGRDVIGYDYSLFIGLDNYSIGKDAGEFLGKYAQNEAINVVEIIGSTTSQPVMDRSNGFKSGISLEKINILSTIEANWEKDKAEDYFKAFLENTDKKVDAVYAHSDDMAYGAYLASRSLGINDLILIGIDGLDGDGQGLDLVDKEVLDCTYICPTGGKEAITYAIDILNQEPGIPKKIILRTHEVNQSNYDAFISDRELKVEPDKNITLGFAQVGSESNWRIANTESIKSAAEEAGIDLIFKNVDNELSDEEKQKKQIEFIEIFIKQGVDVIAFSPIVESGWDEVLLKAKEANIPVILSDRKVDADNELWSSYMGSDFVEEGRRAARWLLEQDISSSHETINIVELEGTKGSAPAKGRKDGFYEIIRDHYKYKILYSKTGNFQHEDGKKVMADILNTSKEPIHVVYAHNDDMALGAIEAIEDFGLNAGKDIMIISIDATKEALNTIMIKKLNCAVECNPLLGPQMMKAIKDLKQGKSLPIEIITEEGVFTYENAENSIELRRY